MEFIGQKFNLKAVTHKMEIGKDIVDHVVYTPDDSEMKKKIEAAFVGTVRIFPPGTMGTQDYKPQRTNVYINKKGVIHKITKG